MKDEIRRKNEQIASLERQIADSLLISNEKLDTFEESQVRFYLSFSFLFWCVCEMLWVTTFPVFVLQSVVELVAQLNEKSFELEVMQLVHVYWKFNLHLSLNVIQTVFLSSSHHVMKYCWNPIRWVPCGSL